MTLSPSALRICAVAVEHLAELGYDGSSLAVIAEGAGMRKASLYAHFAGKDALFREVLAIALAEEARALEAGISAVGSGGGLPGGGYLEGLEARYASSPHLRFLLRTVYAPPAALRAEIVAAYQLLVERQRELFVAALPGGIEPRRADTLTEAYLGAIDSVQVELLYSTPRSVEARRGALWAVLGEYYRGTAATD